MRTACVAATMVAMACTELTPPETASSSDELALRFRERTCSAVIAAYASGVRPSMLEIEVPGPSAGDPPARVVLMAPHIISAESCLGQPDPFAMGTPTAPSGADATSSAAPRSPSRPIPSDRRPTPLDTRN